MSVLSSFYSRIESARATKFTKCNYFIYLYAIQPSSVQLIRLSHLFGIYNMYSLGVPPIRYQLQGNHSSNSNAVVVAVAVVVTVAVADKEVFRLLGGLRGFFSPA